MIDALHDAIAELLVTDAEFLDDIAAIKLGRNHTAATPKVLRSFRPIQSLGQEHYPAWLLEIGDDESVGRAIGNCHQDFRSEVLLGLVWHQQDYEVAYHQRLQVVPALVRLFLRNGAPVGSAGIEVDAVGNDRAINHPTHIMTVRLLADVSIQQ